MLRSTKWKFAIFSGISECLIYAEAKHCAFEVNGEPKYYSCPRAEYCCSFGCCVSPGFQIYHLWYYWLLVIIMFLVCSGGGWWYRYWLQGRYRAASTTIPSRPSLSRTQNPSRGSACQAQQARISYNTARNTVLLHRMWKGPNRHMVPSTYNGPATSTHYQNTSVVLNDANCPYYQLYGPPPSYETVIAQTRGKLSSPTSPELLRPSPQTTILPSENFSQCFTHTYNLPTQLNGLESLNYNSSPTNLQMENFDTAEYLRLVQQCNSEGPQQNYCLSLDYCRPETSRNNSHENFDASTSFGSHKPPSNFDVDALQNTPTRFSNMRNECVASSCPHDRIHNFIPHNKTISNVGIHCSFNQKRCTTPNSSQGSSMLEPIPTTSSISVSNFKQYNYRVHGGSLKMVRNKDKRDHGKQYDRIHRRLSTTDPLRYPEETPHPTSQFPKMSFATNKSTSNEGPGHSAPCNTYCLQSNPSSNNVISKPSTSKTTVESPSTSPPPMYNVSEGNNLNPINYPQNQDPLFCESASTNNSNGESKRRLDRSKSLD